MDCRACELIRRRDSGLAPLWDNLVRTDGWDVVHNSHTRLAGWLVLVARRHVGSIAELSESEAVELGLLTRRASLALGKVVGCAKTYVLQLAEHPRYPHVHFHVVPRMADIPENLRGTSVFGYATATEEEGVSEAEKNRLALELAPLLRPNESEPTQPS